MARQWVVLLETEQPRVDKQELRRFGLAARRQQVDKARLSRQAIARCLSAVGTEFITITHHLFYQYFLQCAAQNMHLPTLSLLSLVIGDF